MASNTDNKDTDPKDIAVISKGIKRLKQETSEEQEGAMSDLRKLESLAKEAVHLYAKLRSSGLGCLQIESECPSVLKLVESVSSRLDTEKINQLIKEYIAPPTRLPESSPHPSSTKVGEDLVKRYPSAEIEAWSGRVETLVGDFFNTYGRDKLCRKPNISNIASQQITVETSLTSYVSVMLAELIDCFSDAYLTSEGYSARISTEGIPESSSMPDILLILKRGENHEVYAPIEVKLDSKFTANYNSRESNSIVEFFNRCPTREPGKLCNDYVCNALHQLYVYLNIASARFGILTTTEKSYFTFLNTENKMQIAGPFQESGSEKGAAMVMSLSEQVVALLQLMLGSMSESSTVGPTTSKEVGGREEGSEEGSGNGSEEGSGNGSEEGSGNGSEEGSGNGSEEGSEEGNEEGGDDEKV